MRTPRSRFIGLSLGLAVLTAAGSSVAQGPATAGGPPGPDQPWLFPTSDRCMACHNGLATASGRDVSIGFDWRASMMAHASRDPYWHAAVRREAVDHPTAAAVVEDECARCHMPMMQFRAHAQDRHAELFAHLPVVRPGAPAARSALLAADGVSCGVCHQIRAYNFGQPESFTGGFAIDTTRPWGQREMYGPFPVTEGLDGVMRSASRFMPVKSEHVRASELCATCHTLYTHTLGPGGEVLTRFPEQVPYLEWRHSVYVDAQSCQDCHMPRLDEPAPLASVLSPPQDGVSLHQFRGGNFFMLRLLNRHRDELGVVALPQELEASARRTAENLQSSSARLEVQGGTDGNGGLAVEVAVGNLAGHKLPTAYPSRRAWLHLVVTDGRGRPVFESGRLQPDGAIVGNDNDADPTRFEPHHARITSPEQVQIYEAILAGPDGGITTGLLTATHYAKDNRVLPEGFVPATAHPDVAVYGRAAHDPDFRGGGDRVRYELDVSAFEAPFQVTAELWYQPISFRWADNLRGYPQPEPQRLVGYFEGLSGASAIRLAVQAARLR